MATGPVTSNSLLGSLPVEKQARLKKAAEGMEAQLFQQVMNECKSSFGSSDSYAAQTFRGMMNETLCRTMSEAGTLGLSDLLVRQLQTRESTVATTENTAAETPQTPQPEMQQ